MAPIKAVVGGAFFGQKAWWTDEDLHTFFDLMEHHGVMEIDSSQTYFESELVLGLSKAGERFKITTKNTGGMVPGSTSLEMLPASVEESLKKLQVKQVSGEPFGAPDKSPSPEALRYLHDLRWLMRPKKLDILYINSPDPDIPIEEALSAIQQLYDQGTFRRFGLSNYSAEDVQEIYNIQKEKGGVLPTVYQGLYNPIARRSEGEIFPLLRKLNIAFYGYSPTAGGFLSKTKQQVLNGEGRFNNEGPLNATYTSMFKKDSMLDALVQWSSIAKDARCSPSELAIRWVAHNSALKPENGDAIVLGGRTVQHFKCSIEAVEAGSLSPEIEKRISGLWETVLHEAPLDFFSH